VLNILGQVTDLFVFAGFLVSLALLIPSIAVAIRRLHDTSRSGWWLLIGFIPLVGWIIVIVFLAMEPTSGSNEYGVTAPGP
jgi:uncharacterized membrane protein YhaH (DUF805 family)